MPFDRIDELLATVAAKGPAPGVVGLVTDATQTVFEGAAGVRAIGHDAPMTVDTVFWFASMTKPLTATAAMQLVERGLLDLDSPVARWLPQLAQITVCEGFDADGRPLLRPAKRPITLRQLLTHTSGFAYPAFNATHLAYESVSGTPALLTCQLASLGMPLMFDPGERWEYGMSTDWVGRLVEAVSGQSLGAYLEQHVLGPLDMRDTRFRRTPSMQARLATVHCSLPEVAPVAPIDFDLPREPETDMGGGGLYSTGPDYVKFIRMILNDGRSHDGTTLLAPTTVDLMCHGHLGSIPITPLTTKMPTVSADLDLLPGVRKDWGLGFLINVDALPSGRSAGSVSWSGMANTFFWIDRTRGLGGVYLTQTLPYQDRRTLANVDAFEAAAYRCLADSGQRTADGADEDEECPHAGAILQAGEGVPAR